jgi:hypothetical protein
MVAPPWALPPGWAPGPVFDMLCVRAAMVASALDAGRSWWACTCGAYAAGAKHQRAVTRLRYVVLAPLMRPIYTPVRASHPSVTTLFKQGSVQGPCKKQVSSNCLRFLPTDLAIFAHSSLWRSQGLGYP